MGKHAFLGVMILAAAALAAPSAFAQDSAQNAPQQQAKAAQKPKVWTNDDIDSVRSPADVYRDKEALKQKEAKEAAAKAAETAAAQKTAANDDKTKLAAPVLSNPKTVDSADSMIAWEQRDIDAQTQFVEKLRKELETAPESEQQHIRDRIKERTQALESTKKEQQALEAQKAALEKKAADEKNPPQQ
jgi:hypothetical protein